MTMIVTRVFVCLLNVCLGNLTHAYKYLKLPVIEQPITVCSEPQVSFSIGSQLVRLLMHITYIVISYYPVPFYTLLVF